MFLLSFEADSRTPRETLKLIALVVPLQPILPGCSWLWNAMRSLSPLSASLFLHAMKPMLGNLKGVNGQMENFKDRLVKHAGLAAGHFQVVDLLSYEESDVLSVWVATLGI